VNQLEGWERYKLTAAGSITTTIWDTEHRRQSVAVTVKALSVYKRQYHQDHAAVALED